MLCCLLGTAGGVGEWGRAGGHRKTDGAWGAWNWGSMGCKIV